MASSLMLHYMPNPIMNSATFTADPMIPQPCSVRQDNFPAVLKSSNPLSSSTSLNLSNKTRIITTSTTTKSNVVITSKVLASVWREVQGSNNWENMVEPSLNPVLRDEIVRYGEFVVACYKAFDLDPESKRYLNCKYGKNAMLREVGLGGSGYEVTKYIYATPPDTNNIPIQKGSGEPKWIGYVATSTGRHVGVLGRRDIVITFRGTITNAEWVANLKSSLTPARLDPHDQRPDVRVGEGFLSFYTESGPAFGPGSCREQLLSEVSRLTNKHRGEEISITVTGHSMGSSLALLLAYDIAELGLNRTPNGQDNIPVTVFSYGGPRVGNSGFKERCEELGVKVLRVVNVNDVITKLPGVFFNENFKGFRGSCSCYAHVGVELLLDFFQMHNPSCVHDLGNYIGLLKSCPKSMQGLDHQQGKNLIAKAKGFLSAGAQKSLDALQWRDAAINMFNLVQSQWT